MAPRYLTPVFDRIQHAAGAGPVSDRELLERYLACKDPAAFEALVRRHGPRVHGTCRKVLADDADIDDAFQATFLVLIDKAGTVRWHDSLAGWLVAVAHRVAVRARCNAHRRRHFEGKVAARDPEPAVGNEPTWREAMSILHEELDRLPDRYRMPLVL
jgi:RNA polymerase sigma factor (sigma-70 family)